MSKLDYCNPPPHVVTYSTLALVLAVLVPLIGGFGMFAYGQSTDAGRAGVVRAETVDARVTALTLVVAEDRRRSDAFAASVQSDIRALSLQMVTGRQPEQLRSTPDGGP